jgi:hypothetical protein
VALTIDYQTFVPSFIQGTSFPGQLELALDRDWNAEVYTWENSYNKKEFQKLIDRYGSGKIKGAFLDIII